MLLLIDKSDPFLSCNPNYMKDKALFDKTVKILVNAYLNDTLIPGNCCACAVGQMVAANLHIPMDKNAKWIGTQVAWSSVFVTYSFQIAQNKRPWAYTGAAKVQIDATGYSWQDLARIEYAFERARAGKNSGEHRFNGLMAVVEVLSGIHGLDEQTKNATRELFLTNEGSLTRAAA